MYSLAMRCLRRGFAFALAIASFSIALPRSATADELHSRIIAGSGAIGIGDGPVANATFMMPAQLTVSRTGIIFVVDSAAQRIRAIEPNGTVSTLAGSGAINASGMWVDGGYADGPGLRARFNHPDGIALEENGTILVADRDNHCLRRIAGGSVTTFAGNPSSPGSRDGLRGQAQFVSPRQLAVDKDGTIYVADWGVGIRKIARDGSVTTLRFNGVTIDRPTGVAVGHSGPYAALFVADAKGLVRADPKTGLSTRIHAFPSGTAVPGTISGDVPLGVPHTLAAFDVGDVVFTDLRDSSVKYLRIANDLRYLGRTPAEDAMLTGGGAEFAPALPQYDSPMGVALDDHGVTYIADTGNRRIIRLEPFDRKGFVTSADLTKLTFPPHTYRVAVVGSSFTWFGSGFDDSISGFLQGRLARVPALASRPPALQYFQVSLPGEFDLIDNILSLGTVDAVVMLISPIDPLGLNRGSDPTAWGPYVRQRMTQSVTMLEKAHIPMLLVVNPAPQTLSPLASTYVFDGKEADPRTDYDSEHQALLSVVAGNGAPLLDLYPAFREEIARPEHRPLFNTADTHYSPYGREFVAGAIYAELLKRAPWASK